eukprot:CAMPEP_0114541786 /NCGR_PEP_ID=MMETSP0114-20121206/1487_1 /TAXON_ID=31324 /ORGANISM="Goniomonas sp, Strain m" /LENGTH=217 /DNA_ID=CAMNT_0001726039 /DNA_START=84 /DNA_END=737 /DNA_ORIENTATION=-
MSGTQVVLHPDKDKLDLNDARQHLESSEELFRVSLIAKNDEITQLTDEVTANRDELSEEIKLVQKLKSQVLASQEGLVQREARVKELERKNAELEASIASIASKVDKLVFDGDVRSPFLDESTVAEMRLRKVQDMVLTGERDLRVREGMIAVLRSMLAQETERAVPEEVLTLREQVSALEEQLLGRDRTFDVLMEKSRLLKLELAKKEEALQQLRKL